MRRILIFTFLIAILSQPVMALNLEAPEPPGQAERIMPENPTDLGSGLPQMLQKALQNFRPDLIEVFRLSLSVIASVMLISILKTFPGQISKAADLTGSAAIAGELLMSSNALIRLGADTVVEINEYGKLLLPVLTGALAAQGGVTKSTAVFAGTAGFMAILGTLISALLIPMTYLYIALSVGTSALSQDVLKRLRDLSKSFISWSLKTLITVFTSYIGLTGIVTGTADAAALKAAKATVSTVIPVVGNILSGASETMLLSAAVLKNTAGLYGIFAVLAIFLEPFLKILSHYWMLKLTQAVCSVFGGGNISELIGDFSSAMGLLLAMTGTSCMLLLIGTVCFMKGVG